LQSPVPAGGLDILLQIGYATNELLKIIAIEAQNICRCATAHRRVSGSTLRQCGFSKRVTGFQHAQRDFLTVWLDLERARPPSGQNVKGIGRIVLFYDHITEFIVLFLQERLNRAKMLIGKKAKNR
jgi:hypothetical protein